VRIEPLAPEKAKSLLEAWLAAGDDEGKRKRAADAILEAGLGALPALQAARDGLPAEDPRRERLDDVVRRLAAIVREVHWSEKGPKAGAALAEYAQGIRGKPLTGPWVTELWRRAVSDLPEGATGIAVLFTRPDDGTGGVLLLELTTKTVPWAGGDGGWILDGGELVDDAFLRNSGSWWHRARGPQADERILVPETKALRLQWTIQRARG
jgi:hypothetical protein